MSVSSFFHKIADAFIINGEKVEGDITKIQPVLQKYAPAVALLADPIIAVVQNVGNQAIGAAIDTEVAFGVTPPAGTTPWPPVAPSGTPAPAASKISASSSAIIGQGKATATGLQLFTKFVEGLPAGVNLDAEKAYTACIAIAGANHDLLDAVSPSAPAPVAK